MSASWGVRSMPTNAPKNAARMRANESSGSLGTSAELPVSMEPHSSGGNFGAKHIKQSPLFDLMISATTCDDLHVVHALRGQKIGPRAILARQSRVETRDVVVGSLARGRRGVRPSTARCGQLQTRPSAFSRFLCGPRPKKTE